MPKKMAKNVHSVNKFKIQAKEMNKFGLGTVFRPLSVRERKKVIKEVLEGVPLAVVAGTRGSGPQDKSVVVVDGDPISPCFGLPTPLRKTKETAIVEAPSSPSTIPPLVPMVGPSSSSSTLTVSPSISLTPSSSSSSLSSSLSWSAESREVLEDKVRESTSKLYKQQWIKFSNYCRDRGLAPTASGPQVVVDFLVSLAKSSKSKSPALMAKAAISHCHLLECPIGGDPTKHIAVSKALNSIVKKYSKPVKKAPTLSSREVSLMVEKLLEDPTAKNFRTAVMF